MFGSGQLPRGSEGDTLVLKDGICRRLFLRGRLVPPALISGEEQVWNVDPSKGQGIPPCWTSGPLDRWTSPTFSSRLRHASRFSMQLFQPSVTQAKKSTSQRYKGE